MNEYLKQAAKEIDEEIRTLRSLNKKQGAMIARRNALIEKIYGDAKHAAKGTVLENIKRNCEIFFKQTRGKLK